MCYVTVAFIKPVRYRNYLISIHYYTVARPKITVILIIIIVKQCSCSYLNKCIKYRRFTTRPVIQLCQDILPSKKENQNRNRVIFLSYSVNDNSNVLMFCIKYNYYGCSPYAPQISLNASREMQAQPGKIRAGEVPIKARRALNT